MDLPTGPAARFATAGGPFARADGRFAVADRAFRDAHLPFAHPDRPSVAAHRPFAPADRPFLHADDVCIPTDRPFLTAALTYPGPDTLNLIAHRVIRCLTPDCGRLSSSLQRLFIRLQHILIPTGAISPVPRLVSPILELGSLGQ